MLEARRSSWRTPWARAQALAGVWGLCGSHGESAYTAIFKAAWSRGSKWMARVQQLPYFAMMSVLQNRSVVRARGGAPCYQSSRLRKGVGGWKAMDLLIRIPSGHHTDSVTAPPPPPPICGPDRSFFLMTVLRRPALLLMLTLAPPTLGAV